MTGATNRRKGHQAERDVVRFAREHGCPDAVTTRNTGGAGGNQIGDVVLAPGVVVEVKNVAGSAWPTWIRQAMNGADGRIWAVVRKTPGVTDPGEWWTACDPAWVADTMNAEPFPEWMSVGVFGDVGVVKIRFRVFVKAVRLDR